MRNILEYFVSLCRNRKRWLLALVSFAVLLGLGIGLATFAIHFMAVRSCLNYAKPVHLVYSNSDGSVWGAAGPPSTVTFSPIPQCWSALFNHDFVGKQFIVDGQSRPVSDYSNGYCVGVSPFECEPVVLHWRKNANGTRLVLGRIGLGDIGFGKLSLVIRFDVLEPGYIRENRCLSTDLESLVGSFYIASAQAVYSAEMDPSDGAHFWFRYQINRDTYRVDGWLQPDDSIRLECKQLNADNQK